MDWKTVNPVDPLLWIEHSTVYAEIHPAQPNRIQLNQEMIDVW